MKTKYLLPMGAGLIILALLLFNRHKAPEVYSYEKEYQRKSERKRRGEPGKKASVARELKKFHEGISIPFGAEESPAPVNYLIQEYTKVQKTLALKSAEKAVDWVQRGPYNVGGRTRGLIVDPDDPSDSTWYAGSATGGMWKTTNAGTTWECLTNDLPFQATTTLAMAKSNTQVIYMGTGESFPGSIFNTGGGLFRSTDKGQSWGHLAATMDNEDFRFINRIVIDPQQDSTVLVATTTGIFKSTDAGQNWIRTYLPERNVEDLVADTSDFNKIYAGVNGYGVFRSADAGDTWEYAASGMQNVGRVELAVSPTNPQKLYASVSGADLTGALYASWDGADTWQLVVDSTAFNYDLLGRQGDYDNTIAVHPFADSIVFFGGVNLWKATVHSQIIEGEEGSITYFDVENTESFLDFVNFTGNVYAGLGLGFNEEPVNLSQDDYVSVEIRFGSGVTQKAHRFTVPDSATSGVSAANYSYQDYVDVPFEVWDVTNNRQLMCSFRDQEKDTVFNLYETTGDDYGLQGREYIFINAVEYNATTPDTNIAMDGGRSYKVLYFMWPTLADGATWNANALPESKVIINWGIADTQKGSIENISDAYREYGGANAYGYLRGDTAISGLHPDQHELIMIPKTDSTFWVLNANDGGLALSIDNGINYTQIYTKYPTTQFYSVSKKPYREEYIGGMQDNGTWQSPVNTSARATSSYNIRLGGDGIETVWHAQDSNKLMATMQNGRIFRSADHGRSWSEGGQFVYDGPFMTRLAAVPANNNTVFTVSTLGVFKTGNFGLTDWRLTEPGSGWLGNGYTSVSSSHIVKTSAANDSLVWAGAGMHEGNGWKLFVSTDQGQSFTAVHEPNEPLPVLLSGFTTHPTDKNTAYALYGLYGSPKILRTQDRGVSWEDITRVDGSGESQNGFPNVICYSLVVFPETPDTLWAGTEIGIMESTDNGESWHYLNSDMPAVAIWHLHAQDNQIVAGTYGRGIWTYQYGPVVEPPVPSEMLETETIQPIGIYPNPATNWIEIALPEGVNEGQLTIIGINGSVALQEDIQEIQHNSTKRLDISNLSAGMYIVRLQTENTTYAERIVIR